MVQLAGDCPHRHMPKVRSVMGRVQDPMDTCWHQHCDVIRVFQNGRLLLQNPKGYVRAADPREVIPG